MNESDIEKIGISLKKETLARNPMMDKVAIKEKEHLKNIIKHINEAGFEIIKSAA